MKYLRIVFLIIIVFSFAVIMSGCWFNNSAVEFDDAKAYVKEHEEELLILYDMYQDLEESGSDDYSEIIEYEEDVLMTEYPFLEFYYYRYSEKMEIWFDNNHDGYDWGVLFNPDPDFNANPDSNVDAYEEIGNGFYIHTHRHGL